MSNAHEVVEMRMKIKAEKIDEGVDESDEDGQKQIVQMVHPHAQEQEIGHERRTGGQLNGEGNGAGASTRATPEHTHMVRAAPASSSPLRMLHQRRPITSGGEQSGYTSDQLKTWLRSRSRRTAAATKPGAARPQGENFAGE
jgi:hypothetical protein